MPVGKSYPANKSRPMEQKAISGSARPSQANPPSGSNTRNAKVGTDKLSIPTPRK